MFKKHFLFLLVLTSLFKTSLATAQIELTVNAHMDFGKVMFDATESGFIRLATNGTIDTTGTGLSYISGGNAGSITITSSSPDIVEIKCDKSGALTFTNGDQMSIDQAQVSLNVGQSYDGATRCNGKAGTDTAAIVHDLSVDPSPEVLMGARLNTTDITLQSGVYSTTNPGSTDPVTLRVIVQ